jgi:hypothetical protein
MNDQYNTNQSIPNKQEPLPYISSHMVDNGKSSLYKHSTEASRATLEERESERLKPSKLFTSPPYVRNSDVNFQ